MEAAGCEYNVASYNTIINAYAKIGDIGSAERWFKAMRTNGMHADVRSYSALIDACAKADEKDPDNGHFHVAKADDIYAKMLAVGLDPSIVTLTIISKMHARRGNWRRIESIMHELDHFGLKMNEYFLANLLSAYAYAEPVPEAERAVNQFYKAYDNGLKLDNHVFVTFTRAVGRERAERVFAELNIPVSVTPASVVVNTNGQPFVNKKRISRTEEEKAADREKHPWQRTQGKHAINGCPKDPEEEVAHPPGLPIPDPPVKTRPWRKASSSSTPQ
jgi:pentatricopeptide repeat protein